MEPCAFERMTDIAGQLRDIAGTFTLVTGDELIDGARAVHLRSDAGLVKGDSRSPDGTELSDRRRWRPPPSTDLHRPGPLVIGRGHPDQRPVDPPGSADGLTRRPCPALPLGDVGAGDDDERCARPPIRIGQQARP